MNCAFCAHSKCYTIGQNCTNLKEEEVCASYTEEERQLMQTASATESRNYMHMTRIEESAYFAKEMGVKKIGIAFCIGLKSEARLVADYFKKQGFAVDSVCCKVCSVDKDLLALEKIKKEGSEAMCNPKTQARLLNEAHTELNFIVGLCVGHDMVFTKNSEAPVSSIITKDRVLSHNPAGALYSRYWKRKLGILEEGKV